MPMKVNILFNFFLFKKGGKDSVFLMELGELIFLIRRRLLRRCCRVLKMLASSQRGVSVRFLCVRRRLLRRCRRVLKMLASSQRGCARRALFPYPWTRSTVFAGKVHGVCGPCPRWVAYEVGVCMPGRHHSVLEELVRGGIQSEFLHRFLVLVFECCLSVVCFLILDVVDDGGPIFPRIAESGVAAPPGDKFREPFRMRLHPFRSFLFEHLHEFADGYCG